MKKITEFTDREYASRACCMRRAGWTQTLERLEASVAQARKGATP